MILIYNGHEIMRFYIQAKAIHIKNAETSKNRCPSERYSISSFGELNAGKHSLMNKIDIAFSNDLDKLSNGT